eukprot:gnl/TRDRNA2_/TRDRNA2_180548_c0_seq1.p1 gnl/TRDRNA2_/TRDRNA2_180548_c0~~gnl/TRDRNA2_/TRDRNA2_180548_c0_seq1.p1  ORF type:complete len:352 (+),score=53.21 gnl/TRDRNA2_/TRDRNA2_180548_c0_seq1:180-1235(+)
MSDEKILGYVFHCIPRRRYVLGVALGLFLFGITAVIYWCFDKLMHMATMPRGGECHGPRCFDIFTCKGMQEATFHIREALIIFGGMIAGMAGTAGAYNGWYTDVFIFGGAMVGGAAGFAMIGLADFLYTQVCGAYPFNVIDQAVLWNMPKLLNGVPVQEHVKLQVQNMDAYPVHYIDSLATFHVFYLYLGVAAICCGICLHAAHHSLFLAGYLEFGRWDLGAHFSMGTWAEEVALKNEARGWFWWTRNIAQDLSSDITFQEEFEEKNRRKGYWWYPEKRMHEDMAFGVWKNWPFEPRGTRGFRRKYYENKGNFLYQKAGPDIYVDDGEEYVFRETQDLYGSMRDKGYRVIS